MVIPPKVWTQPYGTELYDWVATEVLGTRSKVTKEYLDKMLKENIVFSPNHNTKYKLEVPDVNERICFINHRAREVPDWLWLHPNSWAFIRSFELVCQALGLPRCISRSPEPPKSNLSTFPEANALSEEEKKAVSLLRSVWGKEHLNLKDLMCDDEIAKRMTVEMAGGLDALIAIRRRLVTKQQTSGNKEASSSATVDLTGGTPVAGKPVEPDQSEEKVPKKGSLEGIEAVDSTIRIQRMLLRAVVHCRDVQREVARIPKLQNMLSEKENHIKTIGSRVTDLEAEVQFRGVEVLRLEGVEKTLDEKVKAAEKKAIELQASLEKAQEDLASMEKAKVEVEMSALTAVADIEKTMLEQVSLLAPGTDFSKVSAYNKVADGQIVDALDNE
ncbi:hypothetical protein PIB30_092338 [Stylosanthes scabra]|uniref:Uncharacterized protein n=1 Tax=Stylosanthes scabra TaxID=79078 RepID=A0ABU6UVY1_9FABA|nr:hypothetical protein [Stylosanthes scabra]